VPELELNHRPLYGALKALSLDQGPLDQQVGAATPQAVLPVDAPAAVEDALQEGLHQQLGSGLLIVEMHCWKASRSLGRFRRPSSLEVPIGFLGGSDKY